ncbi:hypothetical protein M0R01_01720 [bacterium]|nr:hypothetical protein [bacterium]
MSKTKATILKTSKETIYVLVGIEAECLTDLNGKAPEQLICIQEGTMTIVQNPNQELVSLGPEKVLNDEHRPKSITLAGVHFPEDKIVTIKTINCNIIEPNYI